MSDFRCQVLGKTGLFAHDDFFQMSSDVICEVVLHGCVSQPFVVCCLEEQETKIPR